MAGLYLHVPFCKSRCIYCGFYSTTSLSWRQSYVDAMCREMQLRGGNTLQTIYLGGGTPSQMEPSMLRQLFATIHAEYDVDEMAEVTMECNPDDVDDAYAHLLCDLGINRVSMGVQTFNDERLRFLNRRHTAHQAFKAVECLRKAGIGNLSIDLMFGFPDEQLEEWESDIDQALSLGMEHLSAYSLMYEEGTPLYGMLMKGEVEEIAEDDYLSMYRMLVDRMGGAGYEHYEISNFALDGYRSRHNSSYWNGTPYIGIGAAAHSYDGACRQANVSDMKEYVKCLSENVLPADIETLTPNDRFNDMVATSLRTKEGINMKEVEQLFGSNYLNEMLANAERHISRGLLSMENGRLHLTLQGIFISDSVMSDLMRV